MTVLSRSSLPLGGCTACLKIYVFDLAQPLVTDWYQSRGSQICRSASLTECWESSWTPLISDAFYQNTRNTTQTVMLLILLLSHLKIVSIACFPQPLLFADRIIIIILPSLHRSSRTYKFIEMMAWWAKFRWGSLTRDSCDFRYSFRSRPT